MEFCQSCGSFMRTNPQGYICPNCGAEVEADAIEVKRERKSQAEPVYVMDGSKTINPIVNQSCPHCDSTEAYRMILTTQGEHAGVKQDRSVEKYTCVECGHTWTQS
jgi:DNA-directed RNA polymerase subunit M/transcription elongation factor TFIIS